MEYLWKLCAIEIANAIRDKQTSCEEVIHAHLDRITEVNGVLNAITVTLGTDALIEAKVADKAIANGEEVGLLHGVPITVKENIDVAGSPTTYGVVNHKDLLPSQDAPIIRHLKSEGAIVIGRTNMPDYGMRWHTDNDLHGPTANPWNPAITPGGSSGGEAAAISTGMSPLGVGNDMGGSIRQPAIACGIAGLKPSTGRVSRVSSTTFDSSPSFYEQIACVNGPMARRICDLRLALQVMGRPDTNDSVWTSAMPPPVPGVNRVGVIRDPSEEGVDAAVANALQQAIDALTEAGYTVQEIDAPMLHEAEDVIQRLSETEISQYYTNILPIISRDAATVLKNVIGEGEPDAALYSKAIVNRHRIAEHWAELMIQFPLIVGPVSTRETFAVGYDVSTPDAIPRLIRGYRLTELCNLLGLPSVAVPTCVTGGIPQGVQVIGRRFDEDRCFDAAEAIEARCSLTTPIDPQTE